ncbi:lysozyme inhibitor LprI family protein [Halomonas tibetensis]|uniref:Lysozyme inhibitor LprI family protein n=2 Tax=Halomonas tibetensis TaxID=2259590 RepID=A0ABV7B8M3_9GAMM
MKTTFLTVALVSFAPCVFAAETFCGTGRLHPIDLQFQREMDQSGGVTVDIRNAQGRAYESWDKELNREYRELMALLSSEEKVSLREAQRAWLSFRDAESKFWWSESISDGGTLQPVIVSDYGIELLKERVCQLATYKQVATP